MHVRILLFGAEAQLAGTAAVEVQLHPGASIQDLRTALAAQHPALAPAMGHARFARNHAFAEPGAIVQPADELALIGLVSGG